MEEEVNEMLGFLPCASTLQNREHGKEILQQCPHECLFQIQKWWQDPNMYYAFESRRGALWMSDHGGPPNYMKMVAESVPQKEYMVNIDKPTLQVNCYSCGKCFESFTEPIDFCVYRCTCGQRVVHSECFMSKSCALCGQDYGKTICKKKSIKDL